MVELSDWTIASRCSAERKIGLRPGSAASSHPGWTRLRAAAPRLQSNEQAQVQRDGLSAQLAAITAEQAQALTPLAEREAVFAI